MIAALLGGVLIMSFVLAAAPTAARSRIRGPEGDVIPGRYIVTLKAGVAAARTAERLGSERGARVRHVYSSALNGFSAELTDAEVAALKADPDVLAVTPDYELQLFADDVPTGVRRSTADTNPAASIGSGTNPVAVDVAVIDTGVDVNHPDLNVVGGVNCSTDGSDSYDDIYGHGTHVAGIIGALDNGIGVVGVAPGARIWSVRVFRSDGNGGITGDVSDLLCAVNWVTEHADTIKVVNMSLGAFAPEGSCTDGGLHQAICQSVAAGVTYVVAAGNSAFDASLFVPSTYSQVITVSALADTDGLPGGQGPAASDPLFGSDDRLAPFSNIGADVDIAAPGVDIYSTWFDGGYTLQSGTSMASPHVAGAAAVYIFQHPGTAPASVRASLLAMGWAQGSPNGFSGDRDTYPEPLLNAGADIDPVAPPQPSCGLSESSGTYGSTTVLTCANFEASEFIYIYWDGLSYPTRSMMANAAGGGSTNFTIPEGAFGPQTITAVGQKSGLQVAVPFTMQPSMTLYNSQGTPGAGISSPLKGFGANESVVVKWDNTTVNTTTTNAKGSAFAFFIVPASTAGTHTITATGQASGASASTSFTIGPALSLIPSTGTVGSSVKATAKGFSAGNVLVVTFDGANVGQATVDGSGNAVVTFNVPEKAKGVWAVKAASTQSVETATVNHTVRERLVASTSYGPFGTSVTLTMTGYGAGETIDVQWFEGATPTTIATTTASANGSASVTFAVPEASAGVHKVSANGTSSGAQSTAYFNVTGSIALDKSSGPVGTLLTATVRGYRPGELVTIKWYTNSYASTTIATTGAVGPNGTVTVSFTVPAGATLGAHKVESVGVSSYARANTTFTVQ
jgi:subtilisin family serine protease